MVMIMPIVDLINEDGSPIEIRHSCLMNSVTFGGNELKLARTLFLRSRPLKDRVASSRYVWNE